MTGAVTATVLSASAGIEGSRLVGRGRAHRHRTRNTGDSCGSAPETAVSRSPPSPRYLQFCRIGGACPAPIDCAERGPAEVRDGFRPASPSEKPRGSTHESPAIRFPVRTDGTAEQGGRRHEAGRCLPTSRSTSHRSRTAASSADPILHGRRSSAEHAAPSIETRRSRVRTPVGVRRPPRSADTMDLAVSHLRERQLRPSTGAAHAPGGQGRDETGRGTCGSLLTRRSPGRGSARPAPAKGRRRR